MIWLILADLTVGALVLLGLLLVVAVTRTVAALRGPDVPVERDEPPRAPAPEGLHPEHADHPWPSVVVVPSEHSR